ncbi:MAG TPA: tripartite tricarboxylate transporter substrate binding protein [Burkholderiales bacterium]
MKLLLALLVFSTNVLAQGAWPNKPVRILLGFAPGGNTDIVTRILAQRLQDALGQAMVVENKTGLGGVIATIELARAAPDGYTLLMQSTGPHCISPFLLGKEKVPYDPVADFAPVSNVAFNALALMVHPSIGAKTVAEFIAYAKANPGKLNYGSSGIGATSHLSGEILKLEAGVNVVHVPFRGGNQATAALLAGEIQFMFANLSDALPQIKAGKLNVIAVTTAKRAPQAPELPTLAEAGVPGFDVAPWNGIIAPGRTPPELVNAISGHIQKIAHDPSFVARMSDIGSQAIGDTPAEFRKTIQFELQRWSKLVAEAKIKAD